MGIGIEEGRMLVRFGFGRLDGFWRFFEIGKYKGEIDFGEK